MLQVANPDNMTGRLLHKLKDMAMGDDCDSALMFWDDKKSKRIQQNVEYLDKKDKYYLVLSEKGLGAGNIHNINRMIML
ncbi:MAG: hypothetical protein LBS20_15530 [Prevotella sp.]|jgi:hypothetical protein|nr:hypothetical protein [Prevotella sp.]